ncbi:transcriptional repressor [Oceanomicrobium pacificus]|uniref:Transcriptional repressor n=1 Tax=Oceanomicrobium pacificus TaxID=2692916 RepID=A0A6B0U0N4_9RHOB|nr:transcriptional repressor [Oceanomicrobium pacificus]MXU66764.1 transcriptional repressor [Oceanomicrobium pacificus]
MTDTIFDGHDHGRCQGMALDAVDAQCAARGLRLTPVRRDVLEILLKSHRALGAYDLLDELKARGHKAQPPVAYRALDFLLSNGFVHKIEQRNAYVACCQPGKAHAPGFMICRGCDLVAELPSPDPQDSVMVAARQIGFAVERTVVEAEGLCPACKREEEEA